MADSTTTRGGGVGRGGGRGEPPRESRHAERARREAELARREEERMRRRAERARREDERSRRERERERRADGWAGDRASRPARAASLRESAPPPPVDVDEALEPVDAEGPPAARP